MSVSEIIKAASEPITRLIDHVSKFIGDVYQPHQIKKNAEAEACRIKSITEAASNSKVPFSYNKDGLNIDSSSFDSLLNRTVSRQITQEVRKELNIETIADNAYDELSRSNVVVSEPVSEDWIFRFFNSVENISDEDLQKIWGHILADEIQHPNTYSYRTIETLKNMTKKEAMLFQRIADLAIHCFGTYFILADIDLLKEYDVYFSDLFYLQNYGLLSTQELSLNIGLSSMDVFSVNNESVQAFIKGNKLVEKILPVYVFYFTESGCQLIRGLKCNKDKTYILKCLSEIGELYKELDIKAYSINGWQGEDTKYDESCNLMEEIIGEV